jgi:hypothetical protein
MVRLFNHTRHPEASIRRVLAFAARAIGVEGDVYVKVTPSQRLRPGAYAKRGFPYLGFMRSASDRDGRNGAMLGERPGYAVLSLASRRGKKVDWLEACWWFMHTALHEMAHIRQFRENKYGMLRLREAQASGGWRRMRHDARPVEVDAEAQVKAVKKDRRKYLRQQDLTIDLAMAIEEAEKA